MKASLAYRLALAPSALLPALWFCGAAHAVTDTVFKYSTPKTGYYSIDHMALSPDRTASGASYTRLNIDSGLTTGQEACFVAGVHLPHGATITGLRVWYQSGASGDPAVNFILHRLVDGQAFLVGGRTFVDDSGVRKAGNVTVPPGQKVDNNRASYGIQVCIFPGDAFHGARITYSFDNAGD
jgi:hypothetical protein